MAVRVQDVALTGELTLLLTQNTTLLQNLPGPYLAGLRARLNSIDAEQNDFLKNLPPIKKLLFLTYIIPSEERDIWKNRLRTESELKAEEESLRRTTLEQAQRQSAAAENAAPMLLMQRDLQQQQLQQQSQQPQQNNHLPNARQDVKENSEREAQALQAEQLRAQARATAERTRLAAVRKNALVARARNMGL